MESGQTIAGRYRLLERLGAGGMSVVWRAEDAVLGREVAVKVLSADLSADPGVLRQLYAEARAAAGLRHANVVEVYDYGEAAIGGARLPYVVMELVEGRPVNALLTGGPLPWRVAVLVATQVAAALAAAHARGVVHRDVKPANVMVTASGVKLVDFGISATVGERDSDPGLVLGTPAYLAPERLAGGVVRPATDVYALGLLLYLMVAGRLPWRASTTTQMLRAHWYQEPAPLPPVPELPEEVAALCRRCLAKKPDDRPSAEAAAQVLSGAAGLVVASPLAALFDGGRRVNDGRSESVVDDDRVAPGPPGSVGSEPTPAGSAVAGQPASRPAPTRPVPARPVPTHPAPTRPAPTRPVSPSWGLRRRTAVAAVAAALVAAPAAAWWFSRPDGHTPAAAAGPAATTADPIRCTVRYAVQDVADGRTSTALTLVNEGSVAVAQWRLSFRLPTGQQLIHGSNAAWHQDGTDVRAEGSGLTPGHPLTTRFETSYRNATTLPDGFTLNGVACQSDLSLRGRTSPPTTVAATKATQSAPPAPGPAGDDKPGKGPKDDNKGKGKGGGPGKD
jgi:serine/threonine-protein kinase